MKYKMAVKFDDGYKYITKIDGTRFECNYKELPLQISKKKAEILKNDFKTVGYEIKVEEITE